MIKKIPVRQLEVGMYISRFDRDWLDHSFVTSRFLVEDAATIRRISADGIGHVFIDTDRGADLPAKDVPLADPPPAPSAAPNSHFHAVAAIQNERQRAQSIRDEATEVVRGIMSRVRAGESIQLARVEAVAEQMIGSIFRNPHALVSVARIKTKDDYTFQHSVSVAAIMVAFARQRGLADDEVRDIAVGSLLHDTGKIMIPDTILNKPGNLDEDEFAKMRSHVVHSTELLRETTGISARSLEAVSMHHERIDGSGYPLGLKGEAISDIGRMSAIVDVYDALTSVRVYKKSWEPSFTLRKMLEWAPDQFGLDLVQAFIRCLGIYPVGSLVELESGLVGIVIDQSDDSLRPELRIVYDARKARFVMPYDLKQWGSERIHKVVSPEQFAIHVTDFV